MVLFSDLRLAYYIPWPESQHFRHVEPHNQFALEKRTRNKCWAFSIPIWQSHLILRAYVEISQHHITYIQMQKHERLGTLVTGSVFRHHTYIYTRTIQISRGKSLCPFFAYGSPRLQVISMRSFLPGRDVRHPSPTLTHSTHVTLEADEMFLLLLILCVCLSARVAPITGC